MLGIGDYAHTKALVTSMMGVARWELPLGPTIRTNMDAFDFSSTVLQHHTATLVSVLLPSLGFGVLLAYFCPQPFLSQLRPILILFATASSSLPRRPDH